VPTTLRSAKSDGGQQTNHRLAGRLVRDYRGIAVVGPHGRVKAAAWRFTKSAMLVDTPPVILW
jgi:hypothetical protein